ncbi:MAG: diguanylate cyclase [Deinococcales bacterium]
MTMDRPGFLDHVLDLLVDTVCVVDAEGRYVYVSASCERLLGYTPEELVGRNMIELVHPDDRERTLAAAADIMRDHPQTHFENRYVRKDGRVVDIMWSARWSGRDGLRLAVARDVTPIKRAARRQSALYRLSEAAHEADDLPALGRIIHGIIAELLPADAFLVALDDAVDGTLSFPYEAGAMAEVSPAMASDGATPIARVLRAGEPVIALVGDEASDGHRPAPSTPGTGNWLGVPLVSHAGVVGALAVQTDGEERYGPEHLELLQFVSTQVATVIERKQAEARLRHMALHDPLTDLPNRALFHDRFEVALQRARRDGEHVGLLYLDLDDFKKVNDNFGHEAGDAVLREVARRLTGCVRKSDTVARMGGDEFTVLLTNAAGPDAVFLVMEKVRAAVCAPYDLDGGRLTLSVSMGSAAYPHDGQDQDTLLRQADASMYTSKAREG